MQKLIFARKIFQTLLRECTRHLTLKFKFVKCFSAENWKVPIRFFNIIYIRENRTYNISENHNEEFLFFFVIRDTHIEELILYWIHSNTRLAASDVFHINSIIVQMPEKRVYQVGSKNEWLLPSVTYDKTSVGFCLNTRKRFFLEFSF